MTSQRLCDVILKAFQACAASQGCCNNFTFGYIYPTIITFSHNLAVKTWKTSINSFKKVLEFHLIKPKSQTTMSLRSQAGIT